MRWQRGYRSSDVEDRRGQGGGPGLMRLLPLVPMLMRSPLGWVVLIAIGGYAAYQALRGPSASQNARGGGPAVARDADESAQFVGFVLDDVQSTWRRLLAEDGRAPYRNAKLVLYTDATSTACGYGEAATGPFYCPRDERVYLDLGFFRELGRRLGAPGDFAQAYVIAHELGHHVQKLLGTSERVRRAPRAAMAGPHGLSVRLELQADCYAGIWAHASSQRDLLEVGDLDEALAAAAAVGDDRLQRQATGTVQPETWTHGSAAERAAWFRRGYDGGSLQSCDTFAGDDAAH